MYSTITRTALVACACCERPTPEAKLVAHVRGGSNSPLCPSCAAESYVHCINCGQPSPRGLLLLLPMAAGLSCPCTAPAWKSTLPALQDAPHPADEAWEEFLTDERLP